MHAAHEARFDALSKEVWARHTDAEKAAAALRDAEAHAAAAARHQAAADDRLQVCEFNCSITFASYSSKGC